MYNKYIRNKYTSNICSMNYMLKLFHEMNEHTHITSVHIFYFKLLHVHFLHPPSHTFSDAICMPNLHNPNKQKKILHSCVVLHKCTAMTYFLHISERWNPPNLYHTHKQYALSSTWQPEVIIHIHKPHTCIHALTYIYNTVFHLDFGFV